MEICEKIIIHFSNVSSEDLIWRLQKDSPISSS
jgi:hypothetical protein